MLEIREVCSAYGQAQVLYGATMRVAEGEIVALLGRNGMGKTSLVRSVMGLATPRVTSGSIRFDGLARGKFLLYRMGNFFYTGS